MVKRIMAFATVLMLSLSVSMPSFASVATPSNAIPSDASSFSVKALSDASDIMTASVSYVNNNVFSYVESTIDLSKCIVQYCLYNEDYTNTWYRANVLSDGSYSFGLIPDDLKPKSLFVSIPKECLPPSGVYTLTVQFYTPIGGFNPTSGYYFWRREINNSTSITNSGTDIYVSDNGDIQVQQTIQIGSMNRLDFGFYYSSGILPLSGMITVRFSPSTSVPDVSVGGTVSGDEYSSNIADSSSQTAQNTSAIVSATQSMAQHYETMLEQVTYITDQIHAFWEQWSSFQWAETFPHISAQVDRIVDALGNMDGLGATVSNFAQQIMQNDDKNTEQITNGYNDSSLTSENEKLSDTLTEYESVENELFDQASDNLTNFEFQNPFDQFTAPLADISYFLNGIYYGLGSFNIAIGFSLTLAIALLCIGWYRFRGG